MLAPEIEDAVLTWDGPPCGMAWDVPPGCLTLEAAGLETTAILALPCSVRNRPRGVLLFADDRRGTSRLPALLPVLQKMARIVRNRLEQLALMKELSDANRALEERVDERTAALAETSRALVEELAGRREAQASLRRAVAALENTSEGVIFADSSGQIVAVNRAFTDVTGYEADEVPWGRCPSLRPTARRARAPGGGSRARRAATGLEPQWAHGRVRRRGPRP